MNIICSAVPTGWVNAFNALGHKVVAWNPRLTPIFDAFDIHKPDLFIAGVGQISQGMAQVLLENPDIVTLLYSNFSGEDIGVVNQLKEEVGKPDYLCTSMINPPVGWLCVPPAADTIMYKACKFNPTFSSDVAYVGDYSPEIEKALRPLSAGQGSFRIYGKAGWTLPNYIGDVKLENLKEIYSSTKLIIDSLDDGPSDIPYNVKVCGGVCASYREFSAKTFKLEELLANLKVDSICEADTYIYRMKKLLKDINCETI